MANNKKEIKEIESEVKETFKKKKIIKIIIAVIILIAILVFIFFFLNFKVTFKYNNSEEDKEIKVKILRKIPTSEVKEDITKDGYTFAGYYETYYLSGKQIETIKKDAKKEKDICKEGFKLNSEKEKCVAEDKFDFKNTKIIKEKNIEALWEKNEEKKEEPEPTPVQKETPKSNNETKPTPKDEGTKSLSSSTTCLIGNSSATITADLNNAIDKTINWYGDSCLTINDSGNSITVSANGCGGTIIGKLNNGSSNSVTLKYEDELVVSLTDYTNNTPYVSEGYYYGVKSIKTNIPAVITGSVLDKSDSPRTSASTSAGADGTVTIETPCGQTKTYQLRAVIN